MSKDHIQGHVDLIAKHEQEFLARRSTADRLGDSIAGFAGSLTFVCIHLLFFAGWMAANTFSIPGIRHFDSAPFPLLAKLVAMEAIRLASFILMRQARMRRRADEREHLMLQILLLTENEMTVVLNI